MKIFYTRDNGKHGSCFCHMCPPSLSVLDHAFLAILSVFPHVHFSVSLFDVCVNVSQHLQSDHVIFYCTAAEQSEDIGSCCKNVVSCPPCRVSASVSWCLCSILAIAASCIGVETCPIHVLELRFTL